MEADMGKTIKEVFKLEFEPVATVFTEEVPHKALAFAEGKRGCIMSLFASAAKGKTAAVTAETCGCPGGSFGMGYNEYADVFPGGEDCFCHFLSSGNAGYDKGEAVAAGMRGRAPEAFVAEFIHGERYIRTPELVKDFIEETGFRRKTGVTLFMPLTGALENGYEPVSVAVVCNAAQLSGLVILCNYFRRGIENVASPYAAGCQSIGMLTYNEGEKENPRGIIGLFDITSRKTVIKSLGKDVLTFSVPYGLYQEMEENIEGSFLEKSPWTDII